MKDTLEINRIHSSQYFNKVLDSLEFKKIDELKMPEIFLSELCSPEYFDKMNRESCLITK